ncbi:hypothetical protein D3C71_1583200 [compost metagenome]
MALTLMVLTVLLMTPVQVMAMVPTVSATVLGVTTTKVAVKKKSLKTILPMTTPAPGTMMETAPTMNPLKKKRKNPKRKKSLALTTFNRTA